MNANHGLVCLSSDDSGGRDENGGSGAELNEAKTNYNQNHTNRSFCSPSPPVSSSSYNQRSITSVLVNASTNLPQQLSINTGLASPHQQQQQLKHSPLSKLAVGNSGEDNSSSSHKLNRDISQLSPISNLNKRPRLQLSNEDDLNSDTPTGTNNNNWILSNSNT